MKKLFVAAIGSLFAFPALAEEATTTKHKEDTHVIPASAHTLTANVGLFSQYVFRGLTQTNEKPAIQGGMDYSHASGFYLGTWLSNISWFTDQNANTIAAPVSLGSPGPIGAPYGANRSNAASLEWDIYGGYKSSFAADWSYDIGFLRYEYPGTYDNLGFLKKPNTNEIYGALGYKWITAKYSYSLGDTFGFNEARGSYYLDLSASIPVADSGFTLGLHAGRQGYKGRSDFFRVAPGGAALTSYDNRVLSYTDWKVSVSKEYAGLNFGIAFTSTNARATAVDTLSGATNAIYQNVYGRNIGRSQTVLSVTRTF